MVPVPSSGPTSPENSTGGGGKELLEIFEGLVKMLTGFVGTARWIRHMLQLGLESVSDSAKYQLLQNVMETP